MGTYLTKEEFSCYARAFLVLKKAFLKENRMTAEDSIIILEEGPNAGAVWPPELQNKFPQYKVGEYRKRISE